MASMGGYVGSPLRPRFHSAKKFLSLQLSQTSQAISAEFNHMLRNQTLARKRKKVINEIFATERSYQDHLHAVTSQFLGPLRVACILPENVLNTIFSNVEALQAVNRELLSHMETLGLGDAFLSMAPFIKLYSTYANNFAQAQVALEEWEKKSTEFATFKKAQEMREECRGLNLGALLITPVQRVPRYKLLLESLLNKTPKDHPDFEKLQEATVEINKVAHHINENIRQHENFQKMLSIQNSLTGEGAPKILAPGRLFIKEGSLLKVCSRGSQERMFFLFSDILLYGKKCGSMDKEQSLYLCRRVLPLIDCEVEQMFGGSTEGDGCPGALFKLTCKDKSLLLYSKSKMEAINWFKSIRDAISCLRTCRASLRKPKRDDIELPKKSTPLTRLAARRGRGGLSIIRQESSIECLSPSVCLKDSLYPLRKELMAKPNAVQSTSKTRPRRTPGPRTHAGNKTAINKLHMQAKGKQDELRTETTNGSQRSARNQSETSSDGERTGQDYSIINSSAITRGLASDDQENFDECAAGQSGVKTRAQKRRLSFKEKHDIELFSPGTNKRRCFRPKLDVSCVQAAESPLRNAFNQVKHTPAKLRTTKYVMKDQDLVESTTCVIM